MCICVSAEMALWDACGLWPRRQSPKPRTLDERAEVGQSSSSSSVLSLRSGPDLQKTGTLLSPLTGQHGWTLTLSRGLPGGPLPAQTAENQCLVSGRQPEPRSSGWPCSHC